MGKSARKPENGRNVPASRRLAKSLRQKSGQEGTALLLNHFALFSGPLPLSFRLPAFIAGFAALIWLIKLLFDRLEKRDPG